MEIRVLQLADLLISDQNEAEYYRDSLLKYFERGGFAERPHYIAVTGNLTRSGNPQEFQQVAVLLEGLSMLLPNPDEWRRRILIAPGPSDGTRREDSSTEPLDFQNFNAFYAEHFLAEDYDDSPLPHYWHSVKRVHLAIRILDEFTSVAFFWDRQLKVDATAANEILWEQISGQHRWWSAGQSMLMLSSCVPPAVVREDYLSDAKICTYLVGRTPHAMLNELRYNALSWTVANPTPLFRGNVHRFQHKLNRIEHRGQTFDFSGEASYRVVSVEQPILLPPGKVAELFGDLLRSLYRNLLDDWAASGERLPALHIVRGVPGAGKNQFVGNLRSAALADLADSSLTDAKSVPSLIQTIEFWEGKVSMLLMKKKLEDACRRLGDRISRCRERTKGVLLVFDHNEDMDGYSDTGNQTQMPLNLFELLRNSPSTTPYPIVYLSNAESDLEDILLTTTLTEGPGAAGVRLLKTYWLPLGNLMTLQGLMESYPGVPIQTEDIARLTGCLCGISKRLIDAVASESCRASLGETRRKRWKSLIRLSQESEMLRNSFIRFERFLEKMMRVTFGSEMDDDDIEIDTDEINKALHAIAAILKDNPQASIPVELSNLVSEFMALARTRFQEWGLSDPKLSDLPLLPYLVN